MSRLSKRSGFARVPGVSLRYAILLGAIPTLILIWFLPLNLNKYKVELAYRVANRSCWFEDLESDQRKEKFYIGTNPDSSLYIYIMNDEDDFLGQFNLAYSQAKTRAYEAPVCRDVNKDGIKEIILFTQKEDSLLINVFDYGSLELLLESRFVTTIGGFNSKEDYMTHWLGWYDINSDSVEELYFSVAAGFALYPRRVFRYDFVNDSLISSVNTGASYLHGDVFPSDSSFNLIISSSASSNISDPYPYPFHDTCGWVFNFDKNLELISSPIPVGRYPSQSEPVINVSGRAICSYSAYNPDEYRTLIMEISPMGEIVDSLVLPDQPWVISKVEGLRDDILFAYSRIDVRCNQVFGVNPLRLLPLKSIRFLKGNMPVLEEDLDLDGKNETLLIDSKLLSYVFYPDGQFEKGMLITPLNWKNKVITAKYYPAQKVGEIAFSSRRDTEIYEYRGNPTYRLRYFIWVLIYCLVVAFVFVVMYLQKSRMERQQKLEQQVADLKLQNLRNQLDPHFTFNALNSVGNAIYRENKEKAYDLFQRFTRMIRSSLMVSQQLFRPLIDEIQFTVDFLEFQKIRFRDRFDYSVEVDPDLDIQKYEIPKMFIQGFAENAVKHAFYHLAHKGQINISVQKEGHGIKLIIDDNGIGIQRSKQLQSTSGTNMGEQIIQDQIKHINRLYNSKLSCLIFDKSENGEHGTRIEIRLDR